MKTVFTLLKQVKEYKTVSIITPVFMVLEVIFETLIPLCMGRIITYGVEANDGAGDLNYIFKMGGVMLILALGALITGLLGGVFAAKASTGFAKNLRKEMFNRIQKFSFSNIDKFSTAGLVTRLTTDITNIQNAYQMMLRMCIRAPLSLIFAMAMAFFVSARIAFVYLIAIFFLGIVVILMATSAMKYFQQVFVKYDELNSTVQENVGAIRVVKAFVKEEYETNRMKEATNNIYKLFIKSENIIVLVSPVMQITIYTCILFISWLGARLIIQNSLAVGDLSTLLAYCMNILMNFLMMSMIFVMIMMSMASIKRVGEVMEEQPDIVNPENPVMEVKNGSVDFERVFFGYHKEASEYVLKDINLNIKSGETIGIIGGTGSAKSSLVNLISRLYDVSEGSVKVGGVDVREYDLETLRNEVAVVLQKNVLFSGTILDNLRWGNKEATEEECIEACKKACADDFIRQMPDGYNTYIEQGGTNVSGGQKQRLCIARALLKNPKVIIFDDSTSAVDTATDARIRKALATDIPDTTKFIIAQRINSVKEADRIIVMNDGVVDAVGTHEELLESNAIYKEVYESQTGGSGDFDEPGGDN